MLRWSKVMPRLQVECKRSPSDEFKDVKLRTGPEMINSPVTKQNVVRPKNPEKEERNARIRERYANGETQKAIGKDYDLSKGRISLICKGVVRKVKPTRAKNPEKEERNARIRERYANDEPANKIAEDEVLSIASVYHICKGVERKVNPPRKIELEKRNARIRERFANGETQEAIGNDFDLTRQAVSLICKGVERKAGRKARLRLEPGEKEKRNARIRERISNGETLAEIGKDYGLTPPTVCIICKGVERKVNPPRKIELEKRNARIRERFANGETQEAIGKDYDLHRNSINRICKGVERKAKPPRKPRARNPEIKERNAKIRERFANDEPANKIAEDEVLSIASVYHICKGVERKVDPRKIEREERNSRIRERYANGETQKAIGKDYDLSKGRISLICKGVVRKVKPTRAKNPEKEERNARIRERYANGEIAKEIAKKERLSREHVYHICKGVERKVKPKEERNAMIRKRYANGEVIKKIANDEGLSVSLVYCVCKGVERKVKPIRTRNPTIEKRNARIRERFANGEIAKKIAKDEGLLVYSVYHICKGVERKVKPPRKPRVKNPAIEKRNARIRGRFANGEPVKEIAKDEVLSICRVYQICKGVRRRKGLPKRAGRKKNTKFSGPGRMDSARPTEKPL